MTYCWVVGCGLWELCGGSYDTRTNALEFQTERELDKACLSILLGFAWCVCDRECMKRV